MVRGLVQGVAFRWHVRDRALSLGVRGWVRNLPDGSVEAWLEGEPEPLDEMLTWLRQGPPAARVEGIEVREGDPEGWTSFEIRRSDSRAGFSQM